MTVVVDPSRVRPPEAVPVQDLPVVRAHLEPVDLAPKDRLVPVRPHLPLRPSARNDPSDRRPARPLPVATVDQPVRTIVDDLAIDLPVDRAVALEQPLPEMRIVDGHRSIVTIDRRSTSNRPRFTWVVCRVTSRKIMFKRYSPISV
jgi:hypothetical protein